MPTVYNGNQSPLEAAAIAQRNILLPQNTYKIETTQQYGATHTRALSDTITPKYGKGSGQFLDIFNYGGVGSDLDINGNQAYSIGSGRNPEISLNAAIWGYGPSQVAGGDYVHPNTSLNIGQVII